MYLRGLIRPTDSRSLQPQWFSEAPLRTMLAARRRRRCCGSTTRVAAARAAYLTPDVGVQRRSIRSWLELRPGERVLDVGVGPGFLAAEMAGEVGPTAWSRGSTSAIGCWRSRKGRDAAVDLRGGVGRLDSVSGRQLRRRGLDAGPRSDVQPLAGNEVEERKPPQRFLKRHHMLGRGQEVGDGDVPRIEARTDLPARAPPPVVGQLVGVRVRKSWAGRHQTCDSLGS